MQASTQIARTLRPRLASVSPMARRMYSASAPRPPTAAVAATTQIRRQSSAATSESAAASATATIPKKSATAEAVQPLEATNPHQHDQSFVGMSGGQIFHEMMLRHGVKHIFGYPGGAILPVFDAIFNSKHFEFILPRAEQGAGHAAEGYARVT
ncbi:Acetolactate synthase, mitochondrial, partial [Lunasporangiospora selenospora]